MSSSCRGIAREPRGSGLFEEFWKGGRTMPQGTIKKVTDRGFGFIDTGKGDLFFHVSTLQGIAFESLKPGMKVEYEEGDGPKGKNATVVRPA